MKLPRDKASLQAMRYIAMFDEALRKRGVQVLVGIELEMNANQQDAPDNKAEAKSIRDAFHAAPAAIHEALFKESEEHSAVRAGPVESFKNDTPGNLYEITTTPSRALRAAHRIAGLRQFLALAPTTGNHKTNIQNLSFEPYIPRPDPGNPPKATRGMHINFSLNAPGATEEKNPLLPEDSCVYTALKDMTAWNNYTDALLVTESQQSLARIKSRPDQDVHTRPDGRKKFLHLNIPAYVESMFPGADANPYFAVLTVMASTYSLLQGLPEADVVDTARMEALAEKELPTIPDIIKTPVSHERNLRNYKDSAVLYAMKQVAQESGMNEQEAKQEAAEFRTRILTMRRNQFAASK